MTITGENLLGATSVRFGGTEAAFAPVSLTALAATVPASAGNGPITVTTPAGIATSPDSFFIGRFSDLVTSLSAVPDSVGVGDFLSYTMTVTNRGPLEASNVVVTDRLPPGVSLLFPPSGTDCTVANNVITCALAALPPGGGLEIRVSVVISAGQYLTNQLNVTFAGADPDMSSNASSVITVLRGAPPLEDPALEAIALGSTLELSWPASLTGFILETTPSLAAPNWSGVGSAPVTTNGKRRLTVSTVAGKGFYRLRQP